MASRHVARLATVPAQVCLALALLGDAPQQLELGSGTSEMLASLRSRVVEAWKTEPPPDAGVAARVASVAVAGVAWVAFLSLPYAESLEPSSDP